MAFTIVGLAIVPLFFTGILSSVAQVPPSICTPTDATLGAYWKMDTDTAGVTPDSTTYDNMGMLTGGAIITPSTMAPTTFSNSGSLFLNTSGGIIKSGSGTVNRGSNALYTLEVTNLGPDSASGITVTDMVPAGVTYVPAQSDPHVQRREEW